MPSRLPFCCLMFVLFAAPTASPAQSLWQRRDPSKVFLFYDTQARRVGDLVTVVVRENTDVDNRDKRALSKSNETGANANFDGTTGGRFGSWAANAKIDSLLASKRRFDGNSQYSVEREFSDRITLMVLDVLPNGNLVIGGRRTRMVSGERRTLVLSGVVRAIDIQPDNSVLSQFISNFKVYYEGRGAASSFSNQGWLSRLVNRVWPF